MGPLYRPSHQNKINLLRKIAFAQKYKFPKQVLSLFNALVKPVFEYGSICFLNMKPTHWNKIDKLYTQALRKFLRIPSYFADERVLQGRHVTKLSQHQLLNA